MDPGAAITEGVGPQAEQALCLLEGVSTQVISLHDDHGELAVC